jgi:hypothetical protein
MPMTRNLPSPEGGELGAELARLTDLQLERLRAQFPDLPGPCQSCAFRAGTVPNRCATTVMDALECVAEMVPFYCHEDLGEDGKPGSLCRGYAAAISALPGDAGPVEMPWDRSNGGG